MPRRRLWTIGILALLLAVSVHALADTRVADERVETRLVRLDRAHDETLAWRTTVQVAAPLGAKVWPRLAIAGEPAGDAPDGAKMPDVRARMLVDGEPRWEESLGGDVATWSGAIEIGTCRPRGSCAAPPLALGFGEREVVLEVRILNEPQARAGVYRLTLGPLEVETDRGPWLG